ncbi:MAG: glutamine--fructose-6-phosphate transaminase (isomerizing) [Puniceicoccales bacterium]|jgi:glucosamine--fructose-6-phosphate aminotransferase (isomerizing)|nr:glutamine--fructose-6-phosphate transaminase (isomerizing) [Puniceicoccales bacterium]
MALPWAMCGIAAYLGWQQAAAILADALRRLEYRGYDSAGVATLNNGELHCCRAVGTISALQKKLIGKPLPGTMGIGHTRWATHGSVTELNTHPHFSMDGKFAIVHNGVVENFASIREFLSLQGYNFYSETDTEALVNLIAYHYAKEPENATKDRFLESVRKSLLHVRGAYGIAVICCERPMEMIGARNSSQLILGIGKDELFLSSDVASFTTHTRDVVFLNDNELVHIKNDSFAITTLNMEEVAAVRQQVDWDTVAVELNGYPHFMLKEIFEQPHALENAIRGRIENDTATAHLGGLQMTAHELRGINRIIFCACGTAWCACLVAEYFIEKIARIPVEVEYASEFRYRNAPLDQKTLLIVISQSGETVDTLAAMREAQRRGIRVLAITNCVGSAIAREANGGIYQHSGPEIGVASTKAFTSQLCIAALLALQLGRLRDLSEADGMEIIGALKQLPAQVKSILDQSSHIQAIAERYQSCTDMIFLGRQSMFPIALEGALKLKEISYIHAEGYPAAEMKHGPIALIAPQCPVLCLACNEENIFEKTLSNIQEVRARGARTIIIAREGSPIGVTDDVIWIPPAHDVTIPILATIPVQLFAYHMGILRGCSVDKPRHLAKSVTVE